MGSLPITGISLVGLVGKDKVLDPLAKVRCWSFSKVKVLESLAKARYWALQQGLAPDPHCYPSLPWGLPGGS